MFDSRQYEWADITAVLGGRDLTGIRAVKFKEKAERELLYAKGRQPHSVQTGNIGYEGELTLLQSEYEALVKAGNGSVLGLALDLKMFYGNPPDPISQRRIMGLRFTEAGEDMKQGDKFQEITLPFVFVKLQNDPA